MKLNDKCPLCGGKKRESKTIYSVDLGFGIVAVRNVPASVCEMCGEEWIAAATAKKLEAIVDIARKNKLQIEVIGYDEAA